MARLTRYGHQPLREVLRLPISQARSYRNALARLVQAENESGRSPGDGEG